ncbi:MAG: LysM peptidoglycan-binding domain-containing protein [Bacillota bacterium]|nr:LysM peptidoglycan-binding domain-containing protein [Bacillota bacterium]
MIKVLKKCMVRLVILGVIFLGAELVVNHALKEKNYMTIVVQPGDSVWAIASEVSAKDHQDKESIVEWILKENNLLDSTIKPGQKLTIPINTVQQAPGNEVALNK